MSQNDGREAADPQKSEADDKDLREIYSALSNKDCLLILGLATTGIRADKHVLEKYHFTKKRYYVRLKTLVDLSLIRKDRGYYRLTLLGAEVYESQVKSLRKMLSMKENLGGILISSSS